MLGSMGCSQDLQRTTSGSNKQQRSDMAQLADAHLKATMPSPGDEATDWVPAPSRHGPQRAKQKLWERKPKREASGVRFIAGLMISFPSQ